MAQHLIASNATIKSIKRGDARNRLRDGAGLYLRLFVNGGSHGWRFDYSFNGRRNTRSLGTYPDTSLRVARKKADEARKLVSAGTDPSDLRNAIRSELALRRTAQQRSAAGLPPIDSFEAVAREWHAKNEPTWVSLHSSKIIRRLGQDVSPWIGAKPVGAIRPTELLALLKRIEERGAIETTHRVQQNCGRVFRYAVATRRAESDPSRDLRGALTPWKPEHYPTLTDARDVGRLLCDIDAYEGGFITRCAMKLSPLLFVRHGELRRAVERDQPRCRRVASPRREDEGPRGAHRAAGQASGEYPARTAPADESESHHLDGVTQPPSQVVIVGTIDKETHPIRRTAPDSGGNVREPRARSQAGVARQSVGVDQAGQQCIYCTAVQFHHERARRQVERERQNTGRRSQRRQQRRGTRSILGQQQGLARAAPDQLGFDPR